ncbi:MAG TPA: helix-hairpin-helix domain-containing protein [Saprospiraceae bacterium]|nr:helix-hairpin-helix domain-containing protein [Saprospiraceae bacterium]
MSNKEIASQFNELACLMELHDENQFKIKSYTNAYLNIKKLDQDLLTLSLEELQTIPGIGKSVAEKIVEIKQQGLIHQLSQMRSKTPPGIVQMISIRGLGPKKIKQIWKELEIETPGELLYACEENRLIELKGFGPKIQNDVKESILFFQSRQDSFLLSTLWTPAEQLLQELRQLNPDVQIEFTSALRTYSPVVETIELICNSHSISLPDSIQLLTSEPNQILGKLHDQFPVSIKLCSTQDFIYQWILTTGGSSVDSIKHSSYKTEHEAFEASGQLFVPAECRHLESSQPIIETELITGQDIKGVIHAHSVYSDGLYNLRDMAKECIRLNYQYLVITDHSKSAFYANGLKEDRLLDQWNEIEILNKEFAPFKIFKSIESDILSDGSLDYPTEILARFDLVIASIHSNLKMNKEKAMERMLNAVRNPYTTMLGHPTGRLLLSRKGYELDHELLISECARYAVDIEINANPLRLDLDWTWIPLCQQHNVKLSINPDAHNLKGIQDIQWGVRTARRGGLLSKNCVNSLSLSDFESYVNVKKARLKNH